MHAEALGGSGASVTGVVGTITIAVVSLTRVATMMVRNRRGNPPARWPGQAPGGAYGEPRRPPAADDQHEQDPAYWETEPPEGSLAPDGFIGDAPEPEPGTGREPDPAER